MKIFLHSKLPAVGLGIGFVFCITSQAQKTNIDSLKNVLAVQVTDTGRLHTLDIICKSFYDIYAWDSIARYAAMQLALAKKIKKPKEIALAYKSSGYSV